MSIWLLDPQILISFFFNDTATTEIYTLSLHDALPISSALAGGAMSKLFGGGQKAASGGIQGDVLATDNNTVASTSPDRKSGSAGMPRPTSYAVFCLNKKKTLLLVVAPGARSELTLHTS